LLATSDIVTLHCPSTAETKKLLRAETIAKMKPGVIVVNLARGDLIDTASMIDALQGGMWGGAALDVFDPEPLPADSPLRSMPNVIVASHIASASVPAVRKLRETVARHAVAALSGGPLTSVVNGVKVG
jgi:phosphoglycerate dehydrogenase-like enzyme